MRVVSKVSLFGLTKGKEYDVTLEHQSNVSEPVGWYRVSDDNGYSRVVYKGYFEDVQEKRLEKTK